MTSDIHMDKDLKLCEIAVFIMADVWFSLFVYLSVCDLGINYITEHHVHISQMWIVKCPPCVEITHLAVHVEIFWFPSQQSAILLAVM